jgi:hypothetical protein
MNPEEKISKVHGLIVTDVRVEKELRKQFFHDLLFDVDDAVKLIKQNAAVDSKEDLRPY